MSPAGAIFIVLILGVLWCVGLGYAGAVIARSKNREASVGVVLGIFLGVIGLLILALLPELPEDASAAAASSTVARAQPRRRPVPADQRRASAQARLDEIAAVVDEGEYRKAFTPMDGATFDAERRGDLDALKLLLDLAKRIEAAPDAHVRVRQNGQEFVERLQQAISMFLPDGTEDELLMDELPAATPARDFKAANRAALDIVDERYARGEITRDEFEQLKADLA